jgi:uncharacterized protein
VSSVEPSPPLPCPPPIVSPEARPFWEGAAEGRLMLQRCSACATVVWYPRGVCPACGSLSLDWFETTGRGTVYSFTVNRRGAGDYGGIGPYVLAYVELDEGPRMLTNIVNCDPADVKIGGSVRAVFHPTGEGTALVRFEPA